MLLEQRGIGCLIFVASMNSESSHRYRTLWLICLLHAFTHIYQVALLPLYLLIRRDFNLSGDHQATFLVSAMGVAYFLPSYLMGTLADRVSRRKLLGTGLLINALGFVILAWAPDYSLALVALMIAGIGGSFFHPAATALVVDLFPEAPGTALGRIGMGASVGFFAAPLYCGWRAQTAGWRAPVLELGLLGIVASLFFFALATEHRTRNPAVVRSGKKPEPMFGRPILWLFFLGAAFSFALRDFAGSGMGSLGSLFLQRAHQFTPRETGLALSAIFIASFISNPLFGGLSDRGRIRWTFLVMLVAAVLIAIFPRISPGGFLPVLALYGFFFMASYPMVEAGLMQAVPEAVRGRVFGLFITVGGLIGNLAHWAMGSWVKHLGEAAASPRSYLPIYNTLSLLLFLSLAGLFFLHRLRIEERLVILNDPLPQPGSP